MRLLFAGIIEPGCLTAYPEMIVLGPDDRLLVTTLEPAAASRWEFMAERPAPDDGIGFACIRLLLLDGLIESPYRLLLFACAEGYALVDLVL